MCQSHLVGDVQCVFDVTAHRVENRVQLAHMALDAKVPFPDIKTMFVHLRSLEISYAPLDVGCLSHGFIMTPDVVTHVLCLAQIDFDDRRWGSYRYVDWRTFVFR